MTLSKFLDINSFKKFESCVSNIEGCLNYGTIQLLPPEQNRWVYVWVIEIEKEPVMIIYVGQTHGTISQRMEGHAGGAIAGRHPKGYSNANYLNRFIYRHGAEWNIRVYCRLSKKIKILTTEVSICQAEEIALMDLLEEYDYKQFLPNNTTSKKAMAGIDAWFTKVEDFLTKKSYKLPDHLTIME